MNCKFSGILYEVFCVCVQVIPVRRDQTVSRVLEVTSVIQVQQVLQVCKSSNDELLDKLPGVQVEDLFI